MTRPVIIVVTSPVFETVAIDEFAVAQVIVRPVRVFPDASLAVALSCTVSPEVTSLESGAIVTDATAGGGGGGGGWVVASLPPPQDIKSALAGIAIQDRLIRSLRKMKRRLACTVASSTARPAHAPFGSPAFSYGRN
jgi:hypothetical protein